MQHGIQLRISGHDHLKIMGYIISTIWQGQSASGQARWSNYSYLPAYLPNMYARTCAQRVEYYTQGAFTCIVQLCVGLIATTLLSAFEVEDDPYSAAAVSRWFAEEGRCTFLALTIGASSPSELTTSFCLKTRDCLTLIAHFDLRPAYRSDGHFQIDHY